MEFNKYLLKILLILFCLNIETNSLASSTKIVAQVEDSIISSYELKNKIKIILFLSKQNLSQENINLVKNKALRELIDYKLKENQIIKFNIQNTNAIQVDNYKISNGKYGPLTQKLFYLYKNMIKTIYSKA